jgi:succinyl-diaminopimelate desuccinylase
MGTDLLQEQKVLKYIDDHSEEIIAFFQKLVRTKSITGNEAEIANIIQEECKKDGLEIELIEPVKNRTSVIAKYHGSLGKPKIMMYSHLDTIPAGDINAWKHPPFSAEISDGKIWGRGTSDDKVATCGLIMAFRAINNSGIKLKGDILFTHVADEEKGGKFGFRNILEKGYGKNVDSLFYGHGGSREQIGIAANGSCNIVIRVFGKASHTRSLENGVNAVQKAAKLIELFEKLSSEVNNRSFRLPGTDSIMKSRFSINKCVGYVANNVVPDSCEILIDRRYTPDENIKQIEKEIKKIIDQLKTEDKEFQAEMILVHGMDLSVSPHDSDIVKSIQKAAEKLIGIRPLPKGGSHSSDHGFFVTKHGKPVASYGIGGTGAHMANENIGVRDVILTTKVYALTMMDLLKIN